MSFYFEDDDDFGPANVVSNNEDDNVKFVCDNCGSTDSYLDKTTGDLFCGSCFTQSQNVAATQEDEGDGLDFEDVMGLAARGRSGHILQRRINPQKKGRKGKPLEEYDQSQPLPDLQKCIHGFQKVLREGCKCVGKILDMNNNEQEIYLSTVKSLWMAYLRAWSDGAEKYGTLFPGIRFSLRDYFISDTHRDAIKRVIIHRVMKEMEAKESQDSDENSADASSEEDDEEEVTGTEVSLRDDPKTILSSEKTNINDMEPNQEIKQGPKIKNTIGGLVRHFGNKGREESALALGVSMHFVSSILWLPIARIGIIPGHITNWISSGALPLVNAYECLLDDKEKEELKLVSWFFRMTRPTKASLVEKGATHLAISAGLKSALHLANMNIPVPESSKETTEGKKGDPSNNDKPDTTIRRIRFVAIDCVPNMIGQLVADLGFGQRVLDIALSLIGVCPVQDLRDNLSCEHKRLGWTDWLPSKLKRAHPQKIDSPEYALGVIVVACKMHPEWETWSFTSHSLGNNNLQPPRKKSERDREIKCTQTFIPWNEEQFRLIKNDTLKDYLDFFEDHGRRLNTRLVGPKPFKALVTALEKTCKRESDADSDESDDALKRLSRHTPSNVVLPSIISEKVGKARKLHPGTSDGFIPYLSYPDYDSHAKKKKNCLQEKLTPEPFHSTYIRLIEYISYKTHTPAWRIHTVVAALDEEVVALCETGKFEDVKVGEQQRAPKRGPMTRKLWAAALKKQRFTTYIPLGIDEFVNVSRASQDERNYIPEKPESSSGIPLFGGGQQFRTRENDNSNDGEGKRSFAEI